MTSSNYGFGLSQSALKVLEKGPVDVESTMNVLYLAGKNPALRLRNLPSKLVAEVRARVEEELANFRSKWAAAWHTYLNDAKAFTAMEQHQDFLITIWNVLETHRLQMFEKNKPGHELNRGPDEYLHRFSFN